MEQLFEFLPVLFIVLYVIKKIIEGFKDLEIETPQSDNKYSDGYRQKENNYSEEKVKQKIEDNLQNYNGYNQENKGYKNRTKDSVNNTDKTRREIQQKKASREKQKEEKRKKRDKRKQKYQDLVSPSQKEKNSLKKIMGNKINNNDLIKGVVFKEILDKPRAKKPYQPINKKKSDLHN